MKTFRRHIVNLGKTGLIFIYDELVADEPVNWSYLLHTTENPMTVDQSNHRFVHIQATNRGGASDAYLFSTGTLQTDTTSRFFYPAVNWLRADDKGVFKKYPNHWHFSSTTVPCKTARFLTVMDTHGKNRPDMQVVRKGNTIQVGDWTVACNLTEKGKAAIYVSNKTEKVSLNYDADKKEGATIVTDQVKGKQVNKVLTDYLPDFEI